MFIKEGGLPRRYAPRNDGYGASRRNDEHVAKVLFLPLQTILLYVTHKKL